MSNKIYEAQIKLSNGTLESADIKTSVNAIEGISAYANLSANNTFSKDNVFSGNLSVGGTLNNITIPTTDSDTFALVSDVQNSVQESALMCEAMLELKGSWTKNIPFYVTPNCFNRTPVVGDTFYVTDTSHLYWILAKISYECRFDFSSDTEYSIDSSSGKVAWKCTAIEAIPLKGNTGATGKPGCSFSLNGTVLTITWNEEDANKYAVTMTFDQGKVSKAVSTSGELAAGNTTAVNQIITDTVTENNVITITFAAGIIDSPTFIINGTSYNFNDSEDVIGENFTGLLVCNSSDNTAVLRLTNITANLTLTVSSY